MDVWVLLAEILECNQITIGNGLDQVQHANDEISTRFQRRQDLVDLSRRRQVLVRHEQEQMMPELLQDESFDQHTPVQS